MDHQSIVGSTERLRVAQSDLGCFVRWLLEVSRVLRGDWNGRLLVFDGSDDMGPHDLSFVRIIVTPHFSRRLWS